MHAPRIVTGIDLPSRPLQPAPSPWPPLRMRPSLRRLFAELRRDLFNPYRAERHYMRGPGPAVRARQAGRADRALTTAR
jgi:hypothetical protein